MDQPQSSKKGTLLQLAAKFAAWQDHTWWLQTTHMTKYDATAERFSQECQADMQECGRPVRTYELVPMVPPMSTGWPVSWWSTGMRGW